MLLSFVLGAVEFKLFVGSVNKQATEKELEEVGYNMITHSFFKAFFISYVHDGNVYNYFSDFLAVWSS